MGTNHVFARVETFDPDTIRVRQNQAQHDENNRKIAVQIPIEDFEITEQLLEDYALFHLMKENQGTQLLDQSDAETYYTQVVKKG